MVEIDRPWIRKPDQAWAPPNPDPEGLYLDENTNKSLETMHREALNVGLNEGVCFIAHWPFFVTAPRIAFMSVGNIVRDPDPNIDGDRGDNYFGEVMSKFAYLLARREGQEKPEAPLRRGEDFSDGVISITTEEGSGIYVGFSGGTEDQDVQIAKKGLSTLIQLAEEKE